ncbi:MAG: hypothetical protein IKV67_03940 [Paludibacteraceae bacterium]|nr:hypothetical protein [Paludibacteraceae bacterium]
MLRENNNIIVVDDRQFDLDRIARVFNTHGIGCKTILYDSMLLPEKPLEGIKIAFFDINLLNSGDENAKFATLFDAIKSYIPIKNRTYILVFWTTNIDDIAKFTEYANREGNRGQIANPIKIIPMDKNRFGANDDSLSPFVDTIVDNPLVKCLFSVNEELVEAADVILSNITSLIRIEEEWGKCENFEKRFKEVFSKIAWASHGYQNGHTDPDRAIKDVLAPIFGYELCNNGRNTWEDYLQLSGKGKGYFDKIKIDDIAPSLNSILHINYKISEPNQRGCVRAFKDDEDYFNNKFGYDTRTWLNTHLLRNKYELKEQSRIVAMEISAACDYANNKKRSHRYVIGLICSKEDYDDIIDLKTKKEISFGENVYFPNLCFAYEDSKKYIIFDLNMIISEEECDLFKTLQEPLFTFKDEFVNAVASRYAAHSTRMGFTSF